LDFKRFALYNLAGGIIWIASLTLLGYFLGKRFEKEITDYLLYIIIGFIVITSLPLILAFVKKRVAKDDNDELSNTEQ
jgi:membrane-associated protein